MCLPDFEKFIQVDRSEGIIGYRNWVNPRGNLDLKSKYQKYIWKSPIDGPHLVTDKNSGLYAYNNNNYNNYNNYNYNNYNYYNYYNNYDNYNNYNYCNLAGIIKQYGRIAIHKSGQRSEFAKIETLFTIRRSDAIGSLEFLNWIDLLNKHIEEIAKKYECNTMHWQEIVGRDNL